MKIVAYTFRADQFCQECIVEKYLQHIGVPSDDAHMLEVEYSLDCLAAAEEIDRMDERSFDSDNFPKVIFADQIEHDEYCGECHKLFR